jgi:hypothetical protein
MLEHVPDKFAAANAREVEVRRRGQEIKEAAIDRRT